MLFYDALFMKLFRQATDRTPLSQEQQEAVLGKIGSLTDMRVKAIVSQQKRNQKNLNRFRIVSIQFSFCCKI